MSYSDEFCDYDTYENFKSLELACFSFPGGINDDCKKAYELAEQGRTGDSIRIEVCGTNQCCLDAYDGNLTIACEPLDHYNKGIETRKGVDGYLAS